MKSEVRAVFFDLGGTLFSNVQIPRVCTPVLVEAAIDYSRRTYFTKGVVWANFGRLPLRERVRFVGRQ